ncbi:MAG: 3-phosphoshikimate 1-carboxyvinyltransferase [Candidatus Omnitrophota bacterium]
MNWKIKKADNGLKGELIPPPDKSISHRAAIFASVSSGECAIHNFLFGQDCKHTLEAFRAMGTEISTKKDTVIIRGKGLKGLVQPPGELYLGNSGTTMRIIAGVLAGQDFASVLTGDESLSRRPMDRIIKPLSLMGVKIESSKEGPHAPIKIGPGRKRLKPIDYETPVPSAQVKSCVLAAGLYAEGKTSVTEPLQSRDHTERILEYFSANLKREGLKTTVTGMEELVPRDITIPGDISSAAFFIVAALLVKGSHLVIRDTGLNPTRTGILDVLKRMGGKIEILDWHDGLEPMGDIGVNFSALKGTVIEKDEIPCLIDEIPVLAVAAAVSSGKTVINGISELKIKETNRIDSIVENLRKLGRRALSKGDSLIIQGEPGALNAARLDSFGDHRIAMSMAIAALVSNGECVVDNVDCVGTSYPKFFRDLEKTR